MKVHTIALRSTENNVKGQVNSKVPGRLNVNTQSLPTPPK